MTVATVAPTAMPLFVRVGGAHGMDDNWVQSSKKFTVQLNLKG